MSLPHTRHWAATAYSYGAPEPTLLFGGVHDVHFFRFMCCLCRRPVLVVLGSWSVLLCFTFPRISSWYFLSCKFLIGIFGFAIRNATIFFIFLKIKFVLEGMCDCCGNSLEVAYLSLGTLWRRGMWALYLFVPLEESMKGILEWVWKKQR